MAISMLPTPIDPTEGDVSWCKGILRRDETPLKHRVALLYDPELLLMDEPIVGIDSQSTIPILAVPF